MSNSMIDIDGAKLSELIRQTGITQVYAAKELGYGETYFSNCIMRNQISRPAARALNLKFKIPLDAYKKRDGSMPIACDKPIQISVDYDMLQKTIYSAVYSAMKQAWSES